MKMTFEDWKGLKYFTSKENWGKPSEMERSLIFKLEKLREKVARPIIVHCGFETSGHSEHSYHYRGMAVDVHIEGLNLLDQFLEAEQMEFNGIGIYPYWNSPGLHLDVREDKIARWWRTKNGEYKPLTSKAFKGIC